jgi:hypothetical protein
MSTNTRSCKKHDRRDLHRLGHPRVMVPPDMTVSVLLVIRIKGKNFSFYCHGEWRLRRVHKYASQKRAIPSLNMRLRRLKPKAYPQKDASQCLFEFWKIFLIK